MHGHLSKNNHGINQCSLFFVINFWQNIFESKVQDSSPKFAEWRCYFYCVLHYHTLNCSRQSIGWKMSLKSSWKEKKTSVTMTILDHVDLKSHSSIWSEKNYRTVIMTNHDNSWFQQSPILTHRPKMKVIFNIDWKMFSFFFSSNDDIFDWTSSQFSDWSHFSSTDIRMIYVDVVSRLILT